jgi:hypothetical protein
MARKAERMLVLQNLKIEAKDAAAFNIYCRGLGVQYGPVNDLLFDLIPGGRSRGGSSFSVNLELAHNSKLKNRGALTYDNLNLTKKFWIRGKSCSPLWFLSLIQ